MSIQTNRYLLFEHWFFPNSLPVLKFYYSKTEILPLYILIPFILPMKSGYLVLLVKGANLIFPQLPCLTLTPVHFDHPTVAQKSLLIYCFPYVHCPSALPFVSRPFPSSFGLFLHSHFPFSLVCLIFYFLCSLPLVPLISTRFFPSLPLLSGHHPNKKMTIFHKIYGRWSKGGR